MLPDYPKTKELLAEEFHERVKIAQQRRLGIFQRIKGTRMHEGSKFLLHRADGSTEEIEMEHLQASAQLQHDVRELETLGLESITEILDQVGERIATEKIKLMFKRLDQAVHEVGNVGDPTKPFVDQYLDLLEKQQIDFNPDGTPSERHIVVGSKQAAERVNEAFTQIQSDPVLLKQYEAAMERKRQEWRDRQAARNLVE